MESKQKILEEAKTIFESLKTDKKNVLFSEKISTLTYSKN